MSASSFMTSPVVMARPTRRVSRTMSRGTVRAMLVPFSCTTPLSPPRTRFEWKLYYRFNRL